MAWLLWWWLLSIICVADCIRDIRKMSQTRKGFLRCRTGVTLEMYPDGVVNGTRGKGGKYALLQINVRTRKSVIFFGVRSKQYLCMSNSGMLYGDTNLKKRCIFKVLELPYYYTSYYRRIGRRNKVFFGLTRSGQSKSGHRKKRRSQFIWSKIRD